VPLPAMVVKMVDEAGGRGVRLVRARHEDAQRRLAALLKGGRGT
jgi:hypothetical protein